MKPRRWSNPDNRLFPFQVGFTAPPHDFDAAPSDFLRIAPESVGVHGRMLHVPGYAHELRQRADHFHLLEEVVHCMANNGADVVGQVGTNWVHCNGSTPDDIRAFCDRLGEKYATPFHMAGMCLVEGLRALNAEKIAINSVYYWPDWRDGITRFLRQAGFDVLYCGNFVDQGFYATQEEVNALNWIFPGELAGPVHVPRGRAGAGRRCRGGQRHAELAPRRRPAATRAEPPGRLRGGHRQAGRRVRTPPSTGRIFKTLGVDTDEDARPPAVQPGLTGA